MPGGRESTLDKLAARYGPSTIRWLLGLLWLSQLDWKVPTGFGSDPPLCRGFCAHVQAGVDHPVVPGSAWLFEHLVARNLAAFGWLTLFVEVTIVALLLSGRFVRIAALLSIAESLAIGLAVTNAPGHWYWSYLLMFGLSVAVFVLAPENQAGSVKLVAIVTAAYGAMVAAAHADAGWGGDANRTWSRFTDDKPLPDELGRALFPGSIVLGLLFVALGVAVWFLAGTGTAVRRTASWITLAVATVLLFTYRPGGLAIGLGSRATTVAVLAMAGVALLPPRAT